jgi:hypothetical protein
MGNNVSDFELKNNDLEQGGSVDSEKGVNIWFETRMMILLGDKRLSGEATASVRQECAQSLRGVERRGW